MDFSNLKFAGIPLVAWVPLLPLLGAFLNLTVGRKLSRNAVHVIGIASVAASCGLALYLVFGPLYAAYKAGQGDVGIAQSMFTWIEIGNLKVNLAFRLDTLSAVMILIVTVVGTLIHIYSTGYMAHDPRYSVFFGYMNLFMGAMLILVLASNMLVMFIGWEGVGLCSYLLIGFWYEREDFATAGRKAFVVNRIGDFCFLLGMFLLFWATKTLDFRELSGANSAISGAEFIQPFWGGERLAAAAGIFLFIGACGKSAQLPLFVWLPDAMAGPTPVSALIHAATMVTAGVYMICRLSFLYSCSTTALIVVSTVGLLTALAAAFMAIAQTDLKKVLAYSTVSQLGFMFVAAGTGHWTAAIFHVGTHAFFKACLFLGAGSVMHGMEHGGSKTPGDITTMGGLRKHMPITRMTFLISCLAIAGIVPFAGFFSKDEILAGAFHVHPPGWPVWYGKFLWIGLVIAALGTAFYMWRLYFMVFSGEERSEEAKHAHESPASMWAPLVILAALATVGGFVGLPHLEMHLPGGLEKIGHALSRWLEPVLAHTWYAASQGAEKGSMLAWPIEGEHSDGSTFALMAIALGIASLGIAIAYVLYGKGPTRTVDRLVDGPLAGAYNASKHKLWFDEIYDAIIVRPFRVLATGCFEIVDRWLIDTVAVNGSAKVIGLFGRVSRWFQNGQVQRYLAGLVVGAALIFAVTNHEQQPAFSYHFTGPNHEELVLRANPGTGLLDQTSKVTWDIDGDGQPDPGVEGPDVTVRAGDAGTKVTLFIADPITRKTVAVTRTVTIPAPTALDADGQPTEGSH